MKFFNVKEFKYGWLIVLFVVFGIGLGMFLLFFYIIGVLVGLFIVEFSWGMN